MAGCYGGRTHHDGYYDDDGKWCRTKFCVASCRERCTCGPPNGVYQLPPEEVEHRKQERAKGNLINLY